MTPPCPRCGQGMQWVAQYGMWFCQACQASAPAGAAPPPLPVRPSAAVAPSAPAGFAAGGPMGPQVGVIAVPGARGKGAPWLWIAIVGALLAGGAVAAFLLLRGGGTSGPVGKASARELVDATVLALDAGDVDALTGMLATVEVMHRFAECSEQGWKKQAHQIEQTRAETRAKVKAWAAHKLRSDDVDEKELHTMEAGQDLGIGCTTTKEAAIQFVEVELKYDVDGAEEVHWTSVMALRVSGRWFLLDAGSVPESLDDAYDAEMDRWREAHPEPAGDADAAAADDDDADDRAPAMPATGLVDDMRALRDQACACKDVACADQVQQGLTELANKHRDTKGSDAETEEVTSLAVTLTECLTKVMIADVPLDASTDVDADGEAPPADDPAATGMPACDDYVAALAEYVECDKIPADVRDSTRQSIEQLRDAWRGMAGMSDDIKAQLIDGCKQGADAMRQARSAMGCP